MKGQSSRRSFLGNAAVAGGAAITSASKASAQSNERPTTQLKRLGFACVANNSHMGLWGSTINLRDSDDWPGRTTGMIITHCLS